MEAIYRLNSKDLGIEFVNSVKVAYPDQSIEITIRNQDDAEFDETEYLLRSPANREHLLRSIKNAEEGKIITFDTPEQAIQCAKERAVEQ